MKLYIKYMAAGSEHAIVIGDQEKNNIKKQLLKPSKDLFDNAQRGVFEHMSTSSYLNFTVTSQPDSGDAFPCALRGACGAIMIEKKLRFSIFIFIRCSVVTVSLFLFTFSPPR